MQSVTLTTAGPMVRRARWPKRALDLALSASTLVALSPFLVGVALLVRLDGGPVLFRHKRVGQHGRAFGCLKFRTMVPNAEEVLARILEQDPARHKAWEETCKLKDDPRVTRIGRFLRETSLDELPQLVNVLTGSMSVVGPRPIVEAECPRYGEFLPYYLASKPGITGLWQVSGRSDTTYAERVLLDVKYQTSCDLLDDISIILRTFRTVFARHGAY
jgi:lipopolysaccharide/colanic/teichoic acid biosynthesis glycosyltransferase